jgi:hypothetical protein
MAPTRQALVALEKFAAEGVNSASTARLATILSGPLPDLSDRDIRSLTQEIREVRTEFAEMVWRHPGWAALYDWVVRIAPDCDPIVPAVHAIRAVSRGRSRVSTDRLARRVAAIGHKNPLNRCRQEAGLSSEPPEPPTGVRANSQSIVPEAVELAGRAGISLPDTSWRVVSAGIDIAVDWLDEFASSTGLVGEELCASARQAEALPSGQRLRAHFRGPEGRPLVALLLGGDQWGAAARRSGGCEASLVLWALRLRHARAAREPEPVPPAAVSRMWRITARLIEEAVTAEKSLARPDNEAA